MKDAQHHYSLGKCELRPWWDPTMYLSEWLKLKEKKKKPDDIKSWGRCKATETLIHCCWACKMVILENNLAVSYKVKLHLWVSSHTLRYLAKFT